MAEPNDDDPFTWDVDRVVKELCTSDRTWTPTPNAKFPDLDRLAAKLREGDYDGELLLSSLDHESDLWSSLGITAPKPKMAIRTAIAHFQVRSRKYKMYKHSLSYGIENHTTFENENRSLPPGSKDVTTLHVSPCTIVNGQALEQATTQVSDTVRDDHSVDDEVPNEPPNKKKRRLAATQLMTVSHPSARNTLFNAAPILTEADVITASKLDKQIATQPNDSLQNIENNLAHSDKIQEKLVSGPEAFWGNGRFSYNDITVFDATVDDDDKSFGWAQPKSFGRGRKKYVNGKIKRYFRHRRFNAAGDNGDAILPLLGESDDDDNPEWKIINREIEEEEEEVRREQEKALAKTSGLQAADVDACLKKMIDEYIARWQDTKLPNLQHKAFGIWDKSRRTKTRHSQIMKLSEKLQIEHQRLDKKLENLKDNTYSSERELRGMGEHLEVTIYQSEEIKWKIRILNSAEPPERVAPLKKRVSAPKGRSATNPGDDGIDLWSDEELDDFIVHDDPEDGTQEDLEDDAFALRNARLEGDFMDIDAPPASDVACSNPNTSFTTMSDGEISMYDLTEVGSSKTPIDLCTPVKSKPKRKLISPLAVTTEAINNAPPFHDTRDIAKQGTEYWEHRSDFSRLVITIIYNFSAQRRKRVFEAVIYSTAAEVWEDYIEDAIKPQIVPHESCSDGPTDKFRPETGAALARLFDIYTGSAALRDSDKPDKSDKFRKLPESAMKRVGLQKHQFDAFFGFLRMIAPYFGITPEDGGDDCVPSGGSDGMVDSELTSAQKKKQSQNESARFRREENERTRDNLARKLLFRQQLHNSTLLPKEKKRLIINESKLEGQGLLFVHDRMASRIKNHQIEGVRFMWDEITKDTKHGCLLAHTMGLGKTMQVITLITAIVEAVKSDDDTISCQVPEHLKTLKILITCPSGVLNNWLEELQNWAPAGGLGEIFYVDSSESNRSRSSTIQAWAQLGGVLVMGYGLLRNFPGTHDDLVQLLQREAALVIGDEAHVFKNPKSKIGILFNGFKTKSRIALTGSPLANNVEEYYSMINWVSPGFLGKPEEFTSRYGSPIKMGLWKSSPAADRRKAKIRLTALKQLVAPKVHRRALAVLKDDLPPKKEYIIYLDLADVQSTVYQAYVQGIRGEIRYTFTGKFSINSVWSLAAALRLLLAHPTLLHDRLLKEPPTDRRPGRKGSPDGENEDQGLDVPTAVLSNTLDILLQQTYAAIDTSSKMLILDKILEETMRLGENVLIFSQSIPSLDFIESKLCREKHRAYKRLDGHTKTSARQKMVNDFNEGKAQAFLISTTAGGVGLNIYGANRVVIFDFKYNPVNEQQAVGRAYRIGQTKEVVVYWLICDGTFEKTLQNQQIFKTQLFSQVVDEKNPLPKAESTINTWFRDYTPVTHQDTSGFRGRDAVLDAVLASEKLSSCISSIETTDTFEEEELEGDLTADDQREADMMAAQQIGKTVDQVRHVPVTTSISPINPPEVAAPATGGNPDLDPPPSGPAKLSPTQGVRALSTPLTTQAQTGSNVKSGDVALTTAADEIKQGPSSAPLFAAGAHEAAAPTSLGIAGSYSSSVNDLASGQYSQQLANQPTDKALVEQSMPRFPAFSAEQQTPTASLPISGTDFSQQQPQNSAYFPTLGLNSAANGQNAPLPPRRDAPIPPSGTAKPIMLGGTQERHVRDARTPADVAKGNMRTQLAQHVKPWNLPRLDLILRLTEGYMPENLGGLQKKAIWDKLAEVVKRNPELGTAIFDDRVSPEDLFRKSTAELAGLIVGEKPNDQDPDV